MAAKKSKKITVQKSFNGNAAIKKIWTALTPGQWNSVLTSIAPEYSWQLKGTTISAKCPYHHDTDPSFKLQPARGFGKCFGSCGKYVHDVVELVKHLKKVSYTEALMFLVNEYKLQGILGKDADSFSQYHRLQEMKKQAAVAFNAVMMELLRDKPAHLEYLTPAVAYLIKGRGLDESVIRNLPVGVFPKPEHAKKYLQDKSYEALYDEYFKETKHLWGSVVFHYNDSTGSISVFKARNVEPSAVTKAILSKVGNWRDLDPVSAKELVSHEFVFIADPYADGRGVFGLHKYNRIVGMEGADAYLTEGEFDALSVMNAQEVLGRQDFMMLATGGNANDVSFLTDSDIKHVWVVPDHPSKSGIGYAAKLLSNRKNYTIGASNKSLKFKVFQWPSTLTGLDLDDAMQLNGYNAMYGYLYISRNEFFLNASPWVITQCDKALEVAKDRYQAELSGLDIDHENYTVVRGNMDDNYRSVQQEILLEWVKCLNDPTEQAAFASKYFDVTGIDITQTSQVHSSMFALDTHEGCLSALRKAFNEMFELAYYEVKPATGIQITMWSKHRHESLPIKADALAQIVAQYSDTDSTSWVLKVLRDSPYIQIEDDSMASIKKQASDASTLLRTAYEGLLHQAKPINALSKLGQGVHYNFLPASSKVDGHMYFINGARAFRGAFDKESGKLDWVFVNNLVDNELVFKLNAQDRWSFVNDVADLYDATQVNLRALYSKLLVLLDGWKFENHEYMREYLAAWIMSIPVQRACGKVNITFMTGESNSGKTSFARGLLGGMMGHSHEVPSVLEAAVFRSDASAASMYQEMDESALLFTIDEAETSDSHNTDHDGRIKEIQRMCFSIPQGGHTTSRGGATPDQRQSYRLQLPVLMCGININNDPVFLSRVVTVYTQKELTRQNIGDYVDEKFPNREDITLIRRQVTVGLLPHINELVHIHSELQKTLPSVDTTVKVPGRFLECILPALSVYHYLGFDSTELFKKITAGNKQRLEAVYHATGRMDLIHTLLYSKSIRTSTDDNQFALQDPRTLIMNREYNLLNSSNIGVYMYDNGAISWIVIVWRQAKYSVLRNTQYFNKDESALKEQCSKSMHVINAVTDKQHIDITTSLGLRDIRTKSAYTVLDASYIVDSEEVEAFISSEPEAVAAPAPTPEVVPPQPVMPVVQDIPTRLDFFDL